MSSPNYARPVYCRKIMHSSAVEELSRSLHEESSTIDSFGLEVSSDIKILCAMCVYVSAICAWSMFTVNAPCRWPRAVHWDRVIREFRHCLFYKMNRTIVMFRSMDQYHLLPWKIWANWCCAKYSIVAAVDN